MPGFVPRISNVPGFPLRTIHPTGNWAPGFMGQPASFMPPQFPLKVLGQKDPRAPPDVKPSNDHLGSFAENSGDRFLNPSPKEQRPAKMKAEWDDLQPNTNADMKVHVTNQFIPTQVTIASFLIFIDLRWCR